MREAIEAAGPRIGAALSQLGDGAAAVERLKQA